MALLKFKRSAVPAKVPSIADLDLGELAINTYDGKVYTKKDDGTQAIVEVGGGGGVQTIASADGSVTVTGTTDIDLSVAVAAATTTIILPVRNNTGATLAKGTAVYINGALGQNPTVTKAIATGDATSAQTLGLMTADLSNNSVGNVTLIGTLTNLDTSAYSDGQQLYLSPTTAGALTATKPYAPSHLVYMAVVEHAHPSLGKLFVKVQNGYEMDELHDVSAQNPANNDGLFYNTTSGLWEKKSIITALGYTPYNATNPSGYITSSASITGSAGSLTGFTNSSSANPVTPDALTNNGLAYVTGVSLLGQTDGALYAQAYSTSWVHQIYGDYRTGQIALRGKNSGTWQAWRTVLDSSNYTSYAMPSGSSATNSVDVRAPIFYDSNNTGYYVDAASTSVLNTVNFGSNPTSGGGGGRIIPSTGSPYSLRQEFGSDNSGWRYGIAKNVSGAVTTLFYVEDGGQVLATGDFRAPIFYDSGNTAYYLDPASTGTSLIAAGGVYAAGQVRASGWWGEPSASATGLAVEIGESGNRCYITAYSRDAAAYGPMSIEASDFTFTGVSGGYIGVNTSVRAPIFYDSNNTAYYIDPASGSILGGNVSILGGRNITFDTSGGSLTIKGDSGGWGTGLYFLGSAGTNRGGFGALGGGDGLSYLWAGNAYNDAALYIYPSGYAQAAASLRAPIFYDSNNTAYYVDPASTSNLVGLTVANTITGSITGTAAKATDLNQARYVNNDFNTLGTSPQVFRAYTNYIPSGGSYNQPPNGAGDYKVLQWGDVEGGTSGNWGGQIVQNFYDDRMWFRRSYGTTWQAWREFIHDGNYTSYAMPIGSSATNSVDVRAPIFYDSNDTTYYVDPAGTGTSAVFAGDININAGFEDNKALRFREGSTDIYGAFVKYTAGDSLELGTRNNSTTDTRAIYISRGANWAGSDGSFRAPIFYDSNNTSFYIDPQGGSAFQGALVIGPNTSGNYTRFGGNGGASDMSTLSTSNGNLHIDAQSGSNLYLGWYNTSLIYAGGGIAATIYYDRDDTGYYVDPASTSILNGLTLGGRPTTLAMYYQGFTLDANTMAENSTGFTYSVNAPYTGPIIRISESGYSLQLNAPYGGGNGLAFRTRNGDAGTFNAWQNLAVYGTTLNAGALFATVYYDSNDTGYYLDPNSTGKSLNVAGNIDCIARSAAWAEGVRVRVPTRATWGGIRFTRDEGNSNGNWAIGFTGIDSTDDLTFWGNLNGGEGMRARLTHSGDFSVAGAIVAAGNVTAYSDIRIKANVETIPSALDKLDQIRGVTYTRTDLDDKERRYAGVIAQELEAVLPEAINDLGNIKAVDYNATIALLIQAVKELRDEVEALRK